MSELHAYYEAFRTGYWADEDPKLCRCRGGGWASSEVDTWHKCPIHYNGQRHPEDYEPGMEEGGVAAEVPAEVVHEAGAREAEDWDNAEDIPF